jgi:hypothetical protein
MFLLKAQGNSRLTCVSETVRSSLSSEVWYDTIPYIRGHGKWPDVMHARLEFTTQGIDKINPSSASAPNFGSRRSRHALVSFPSDL